MSRGLGRVERLLLHHVYHVPPRPNLLGWGFNPRSLATTRSEAQSYSRAARSLVKKGLVIQVGLWTNNLKPLEAEPLSVANCSACTHLATHTREAV